MTVKTCENDDNYSDCCERQPSQTGKMTMGVTSRGVVLTPGRSGTKEKTRRWLC